MKAITAITLAIIGALLFLLIFVALLTIFNPALDKFLYDLQIYRTIP